MTTGPAGARPSDKRPIFILGAPRSGTTLLYHLMLSSGVFPKYMAESKVLQCWGRYGRLHRARDRERFLADFLESRQFARSGLEATEFRARVEDGVETYTDFLRLLMDGMARARHKDRWLEKTPKHVWHVDRLAEAFESARFIHIIRDGRDVALSIRRMGWSPAVGRDETRQLVAAAIWWETDVEQARRSGARLGDRYLEIRYEDLVGDLDDTMERVCTFAGIGARVPPRGPDRPDYVDSSNTAFDAPPEGISTAAVGRWRRRLDDRKRAALSYAIADTLERFGYERCETGGDPGMRTRIFAGAYRSLRRAWNLLKARTPLARLAGTPLEIGEE